ncbi:type II secretion system protein [Herbaspirillum sp. RV1423]|uniref:type II secretion system protein n=1 Tax=Herbaspirillum sp. RV1423 TaxID=1443993 RepID=UPI0004B98485|nr:type II secretion system protein [Herbaspirillum sp. RV1423]
MTDAMRKYEQGGFTIVELLVTIVIVSILASVALPMASLATKRNKEAELRHALREIRGALDQYKKAVDDGRIEVKAGESGYPPDLEILQRGVTDIKSAASQKIYFLRRIPRDPFQSDDTVAAAANWGRRSYASSAEEPKAGSDVFDVYSLSEGIGLNGIAYRDW